MPFSCRPHQSPPVVFSPRWYSISPTGPRQQLPLSTSTFTTYRSQPEEILPTLTNNSLMSTSKFVDAGYTVVYDDKEVNYYKKATIKIILSEDAVLQGWRCPRNKLWCVPRHRCLQLEHGHDPTQPPSGPLESPCDV
jgi:hypothetical protein